MNRETVIKNFEEMLDIWSTGVVHEGISKYDLERVIIESLWADKIFNDDNLEHDVIIGFRKNNDSYDFKMLFGINSIPIETSGNMFFNDESLTFNVGNYTNYFELNQVNVDRKEVVINETLLEKNKYIKYRELSKNIGSIYENILELRKFPYYCFGTNKKNQMGRYHG